MGVYAPRAVDKVEEQSVLADVAQVVDRTDCIMVSPGIPREETERLGFRHAGTAQEALGMHLRGLGRQMGGLYVTLFNWLEGPPAFAPALFIGLAAIGLMIVRSS